MATGGNTRFKHLTDYPKQCLGRLRFGHDYRLVSIKQSCVSEAKEKLGHVERHFGAAYRQSLAGQNPILFTLDAADAAGPW